MRLVHPLGGRWRLILADPSTAPGRLALASGPAALAEPGLGTVLKETRTGLVQRLGDASGDSYCKVYSYPTARDRRRGFLRNTWLGPSRARREADALLWLRAHGFAAPRPVLVAELRRLGVLHAAVIATEAVAGAPLDREIPRMTGEEQRLVLGRLREFVIALHRAGFRDRNLDLRNILLCGSPSNPHFVKIDSPRHRLTRAGRLDDRLARADWSRLDASLRELGLRWPAQ